MKKRDNTKKGSKTMWTKKGSNLPPRKPEPATVKLGNEPHEWSLHGYGVHTGVFMRCDGQGSVPFHGVRCLSHDGGLIPLPVPKDDRRVSLVLYARSAVDQSLAAADPHGHVAAVRRNFA